MPVYRGIIERIESKDYYVRIDTNESIRAILPGKIKNKFHLKNNKQSQLDIVALGDFVLIETDEKNLASILEIEERRNIISRKAPKIKARGKKGERLEQIIAANVDFLVIITSLSEPRFNNRFLDRMLVIAESNKIEPLIVINKIDLDQNEFQIWEKIYQKIGYFVIGTSAKNKLNLEKLREKLFRKRAIFWGQSGVGKSSLVNALFPQLNLKTKEISNFSNKGTHTTVTSSLFKIDEFELIDTPGVREIEPFGLIEEDLGHYFPEFSEYLGQCKYYSCTHNHEPNCAIRNAVEHEKISHERYKSYLNLMENIEDNTFS